MSTPTFTARLRGGLRASIRIAAQLCGYLRFAPNALRRRLREQFPSESQHLFVLTVAVGVVCGLAAVAFHLAIRASERLFIERAMTAPGSSWMAWTVLTPTVGGLLAGALLTWVVPFRSALALRSDARGRPCRFARARPA